MDYFRILNLKKEPFSNSPEPEFFFPSPKHVACLQQLELSIRLRRGLIVVMGEVGTGKTTLCRALILRLSESEEDRDTVQTHLLLDPSFSSSREFLITVSRSFGLPATSEDSEWQLKERIKKYLFQKGVDEKKTVVIIIDEGQKVPDFCLELLREFLNYETNENKLLQIVIFAQNEFRSILEAHANFADRINQCYLLKPLNFKEMREMLRFRINRAGRPEDAPEMFTLPGLLAIYQLTKGYPRKVITLCHQIMLTLIIQNKSKAGWFLARSCAMRSPAYHVGTTKAKPVLKWAAASFAAAVLAFFFVNMLMSDRVNLAGFFVKKTDASAVSIAGVQPAPIPESQAPAPAEPVVQPPAVAPLPTAEVKPQQPVVAAVAPSTPARESQQATDKMPEILGKLTVRKGGTVYWMFKRIFENFTLSEREIKVVQRYNPHIRNINMVRANDEVVIIPAIPGALTPGTGNYRVRIARKGTLEEAYNIVLDHPAQLPPLRLLSYWNSREGLVFAILLKGEFADEASAMHAIRLLPPSMAAGATVIHTWEKDTVFFTNC